MALGHRSRVTPRLYDVNFITRPASIDESIDVKRFLRFFLFLTKLVLAFFLFCNVFVNKKPLTTVTCQLANYMHLKRWEKVSFVVGMMR